MLVIVCVMFPVNPAGHDNICDWVLGTQVGGFAVHVFCVSVHSDQTFVLYGVLQDPLRV